jgi:GNAT superfamily N-acetyltransferase
VESARPAIASELADLARLWTEAVAELEGQRGGRPLADTLTRNDLYGYLDDALGDPESLVVVGLIDETPVGIASLRADRRRDLPLGKLELLYVEPEARGVGVADAMLALVADKCREWDVAGIDAPALPGNRGAKSFFEAHGFTARLLLMHRSTDRA